MKKYILLIVWILALIFASIITYNNYDSEALNALAQVALLTSTCIMAYSVYQRNKSKEEIAKAIELEKVAKRTKEETLAEGQKLKNEAEQNLVSAMRKEIIISETQQTYPWLAALLASYNENRDNEFACYLINKPHPAFETAVKVREIAKEKRQIETQLRQTQHQLLYYETVFPWLEEFKELDPREAFSMVSLTDGDDEYEYLRLFLSPEEYKKLPTVEKYQRALDRYKVRKKNKLGSRY